MRSITLFLCFLTTVSSTRNWIRFDMKCFEFGAQKENQSKARELCQQRDAELTTISNEREFEFVKTNNIERVWLSVTRESENIDFKLEDGRPIPTNWWAPNQPRGGLCLVLDPTLGKPGLRSRSCNKNHSYSCLKAARWERVNIDDYYFDELCGVEIMSNCEGLSCEELCESHNDCDQFAKMNNVCVNIKMTTQTDQCVVKLRPNLELYRICQNLETFPKVPEDEL